MKNLKQSEELELKEFRDNLFKEGIGMGIVISLHIYESLNLKKISRLIDKGETTVLNQVKKLIDKKIIEIDSKTSAMSRGKYYKLSDMTKMALQIPNEKPDLEEFLENINLEKFYKYFVASLTDPEFHNAITHIKSINMINNYIERISIETINSTYEKLLEIDGEAEKIKYLTEQSFPMGNFSFSSKSIKMTKYNQIRDFIELFFNFSKELELFEQKVNLENKTMDKPEVEINQYLYISTLPIFRDLND